MNNEGLAIRIKDIKNGKSKIPIDKTSFSLLTSDAMIQLLIRMDEETRNKYCENIGGIEEICESREFYLQKLRYLAEGMKITDKELLEIFDLVPKCSLEFKYATTILYFLLPDANLQMPNWHRVYLNLPIQHPNEDEDFPHLWMIAAERGSRQSLISLLKKILYLPAIFFFYVKHGEDETKKLLSEVPFTIRTDENDDILLQKMLRDEALKKLIRERRDIEILTALKTGDGSITNDNDVRKYLEIIAELTSENDNVPEAEEETEEVEESDDKMDGDESSRDSQEEDQDEEEIETIIRSLLHQEVTDDEVTRLYYPESSYANYANYFTVRDYRTVMMDDIYDKSDLFLWTLQDQESTRYLIDQLKNLNEFANAFRNSSLRVCNMIIIRARQVLTPNKFIQLASRSGDIKKNLFIARLTEDETKEYEKRKEERELQRLKKYPGEPATGKFKAKKVKKSIAED